MSNRGGRPERVFWKDELYGITIEMLDKIIKDLGNVDLITRVPMFYGTKGNKCD